MELYRENLRDLLLLPPPPTTTKNSPSNHRGRDEPAGPAGNRSPDLATPPLHVATCPYRGVWVRGAVEVDVDHRDGGRAALERLRAASARRAVGRTGLNADSSRSHLIVGFRVETTTTAAKPGIEPGTSRSAKLFLVDLAGCEKATKSLATGERLDEAKGINRSLSALGNVVSALVERDRGAFGGNPPVGSSSPDGGAGVQKQTSHVPYRDSKLTFLLQESLGGNARATLVVCLSPDVTDTAETISSLRFGARARRVSARLERGNRSVVPGSIRGGGERAAAEIAALRAQVAALTRELAAASAARERIEATGSVDARDRTRNLPTKFSKLSRFDVSGRVRARGGGVLDALTASLGDGTTRFAFRSDVGERNEGWAAPIVAGVALSLLFQAIDNVAAAAALRDLGFWTLARVRLLWTFAFGRGTMRRVRWDERNATADGRNPSVPSPAMSSGEHTSFNEKQTTTSFYRFISWRELARRLVAFGGGPRAPRHVGVHPVAVKRRGHSRGATPRERIAPRVARSLSRLAPVSSARASGSLRAGYRAPAAAAAVSNGGAVLGDHLRAVGFHERGDWVGFRALRVVDSVGYDVDDSGHPLVQPPPPEQPAVR